MDLGCGNGYLLKQIRDAFPENMVDLTGLEVCPELVEVCKKDEQRIEYILGDARISKQFAPGSFDVILSERAIINLPNFRDQKTVFNNIYNWLKPSGALFSEREFSRASS